MSVWPDDLPGPQRIVSIHPGRRVISNDFLSGRRIARNWGAIPPDMISIQLRISYDKKYIFNYFWNSIGMDGIWFTANWLQSIGYNDHKARFIGYPRRKGVSKNIIDYSINLLVQTSSLCIDPDPWPSSGPGNQSGWNLSTSSYDSISFDAGAQESLVFGLFFKPDGTKMYILGHTNDTVYQYTLSSAWDVSSASYDSISFDVSSQSDNPYGIFFKPDGTKMYVIDAVSNYIYQYTLSSAWDVSSASYDSISFDVSSQDSSSSGLFFKPDGTKMYMVGYANSYIYQYTLSSAWDVSSASYDSISFDVSSQDAAATNLFFKLSGTKMYMVGYGNDTVYQYTLTS